MSMRDEFERIYKSVHKGHKLDRDPVGTYVNMAAQVAWEFWQAARAQGGQGAREASSSDAPAYLWDQTERDAWAIGRNAHPPSGANQGGVPQGFQKSGVWQFYQDGEWRVGMSCNNHRQNTEEAGFPTRDLYALITSPNKPEQECCCGETEEAWRLCPEHGLQEQREGE